MVRIIPVDLSDPDLKRFFESIEPTPEDAVYQVAGGEVYFVKRRDDHPPHDGWTEAKNDRRADLIDRKIAGTITPDEETEIEDLQEQMLRYRDQVAPRPLEELRQIHDRMLALSKQNGAATKSWHDKLNDLAALKPDWNRHDAPTPSILAIRSARILIDLLVAAGQPPTRVAASAVGGVGVTRQVGNRMVYIESYNDGRVFALFANEAGDEEDVIQVNLDSSNDELLHKVKNYLNG